MMWIGYSLYILTFITAFVISYYYIIYAMRTTTIQLISNIIVANVMQLSVYTLAIFGWFFYTYIQRPSHFFIGLQLACWFFIISQLTLIVVSFVTFKKYTLISIFKKSWQQIKRVYKNMKTFVKV